MTFIAGLIAPYEGLRLFFKHSSIRRRIYIPLFASVLIFALGISVFFHAMPQIYDQVRESLMTKVQSELSQIVTSDVMDATTASLEGALRMSVYIVGFLFLILLLFIVITIVFSVFWEILVEEVVRLYGSERSEQKNVFEKWIQVLTQELMKQSVFISLIVFSYIVVLVPVIGSAISLVLGPVLITIWFSFMICDYWFGIKEFTFKSRMHMIWKYLMYFVGIGSYLIIPLIGFILYPFFVIGAAYQWTVFSKTHQIQRVEDGSSTPINPNL